MAPEVLAHLAREADSSRSNPWPQPLVSHYARYFRDGNRTAYEDLVAARQQRLTRSVVLAALPASTSAQVSTATTAEWLDDVIDGAYLLCEQSSWSWAAHEDVYALWGEVVPDPLRPYLDLGAGEVAAQLAWLDHVLGSQLDERAPGLRKRLRHETLNRVIHPFLERHDWHWLGLDGDVHNWNPWIHSNLIAAALLLVDDPGLQAQTIARCIEGLDRFLAVIPPDGAIDEGFAYWWNGAGRALEGLALLEQATGGELNVDLPVLRELAAFPHRMHLGHQWYLNVADGPARAARNLPWDMLQRWALRLGDAEAAQHAGAFASSRPDATAGLGRVLHVLLAPAPGATDVRPEPPLRAFSYHPSVQIMVARQTAGTAQGLTLAAKGGHNGEHHNHRDVGSVVVAVDGVPLLVDAGQPTYTARTFGPDRYGIRAMQSSWHCVPAPYGLEQGTGAEFAATVLREPTPAEPVLSLGLGYTYGLDAPDAWIRTSALHGEAGCVVIDDRWSLQPGTDCADSRPDTDITYLMAGTVDIDGEATATVSPEGIPDSSGRGLRLRWTPAAAVVLTDEWQLADPLLNEVWGEHLTRLRFRMPAELRDRGTFTLTVEATP
ncbi:heparinase [Pseudarthrobacter sp. J75]|uniref:heparinase n=1 Tax=unclassified Pseudarthrobacter TaxID=2647000 RepID=UPI002E8077D5|nr:MULTISPECIES: heparinase [unclassified Pseudarthrobacter]MEE2524203.1 heparinase [Pseudarthrobacter sp. J47]MEE2530241.1 heparinase [Pseudarthrobacter sp. J75]